MRFQVALGAIAVAALAFAMPAGAAEERPLPGAPQAEPDIDLTGFTEEERGLISDLRSRGGFMAAERLVEWWKNAPEYLKVRVRAAPRERRWPVILCNYFGFSQTNPGSPPPEQCEDKLYADIQRGATMWNAEGQFIGPDDACRARNKRNEYGQLVCS